MSRRTASARTGNDPNLQVDSNGNGHEHLIEDMEAGKIARGVLDMPGAA